VRATVAAPGRRRIVRRHGGTIRVGARDGGGPGFTVELPVAPS